MVKISECIGKYRGVDTLGLKSIQPLNLASPLIVQPIKSFVLDFL
jgi:hypothetical protein